MQTGLDVLRPYRLWSTRAVIPSSPTPSVSLDPQPVRSPTSHSPRVRDRDNSRAQRPLNCPSPHYRPHHPTQQARGLGRQAASVVWRTSSGFRLSCSPLTSANASRNITDRNLTSSLYHNSYRQHSQRSKTRKDSIFSEIAYTSPPCLLIQQRRLPPAVSPHWLAIEEHNSRGDV